MIIEVKSANEMKELGKRLSTALIGGEIIELVGDVGAGKTTLLKGIAEGLEVHDDVQSPSFTINRIYKARDDLVLAHYDFYRLTDIGIMEHELQEALDDKQTIVAIEWGNLVEGVLPSDRLRITIVPLTEDSRRVIVEATGESLKKVEHAL